MICGNVVDLSFLGYLMTGSLHFPEFCSWYIEIPGLWWPPVVYVYCGIVLSAATIYADGRTMLGCLFGCPANVCCMVMIVACGAEVVIWTFPSPM